MSRLTWGRNKFARLLPADCVPFRTIRKNGITIKQPISWHHDWEGWSFGRLANNTIDEHLIQLERQNG